MKLMKSMYNVLGSKELGEYTSENLIQDLKSTDLWGEYQTNQAVPTPAKIMSFSRSKLFKASPIMSLFTIAFYESKGVAMSYKSNLAVKLIHGRLRKCYIPYDTIFIPGNNFAGKHVLEHEKIHHIHKNLIQSFLSSQDDDLVKNTLDYLLTHKIKETELKNCVSATKLAFPEIESLLDAKDNIETIREYSNYLSGLVMSKTPFWAKECFAEHYASSKFISNTNKIYIAAMLLSEACMLVNVLNTLLNDANMHSMLNFCKIMYITGLTLYLAKSFSPYMTGKSQWSKFTKGLNSHEKFLISAFPPKKKKDLDQQLKTLNEYF